MTSKIIPHLLEPYLSLPEEGALIVLTSILGASTNWLVWRYLHSFLKPAAASSSSTNSQLDGGGGGGGGNEEVSVLLVSFLRDFVFYREGMGRLGVDLEVAAGGRRNQGAKFGFVDGLTGLFVDEGEDQKWKRSIRSSDAREVGKVVGEALDQLSNGPEAKKKVVLVLDGLDFLVAAAGSAEEDGSDKTGEAVREMVMDLREKSHATIITLAADDPLIKEQVTPLETNHAWFALSLAHDADTILSLRLLDTGTAKDVSGVVRITHGGQNFDTKDHEYLYHVGGDGGVRVFERGQ
ncbi:hypothetical protein QBC42DRAFT_216283 [Cladorrhinum samala]|uniref:Elongator complex protein 6 n=1 Tax=Cladorrhinum samala TaxID=585594 RepID=A0AAV9I5E4_9PEZI|nr:hypothetical protein QBC42DRAFT_216283 [Cladorrhinum samala]